MEKIGVKGIVSLYKIPDYWTDDDFKKYWCPTTDEHHHVITPAWISKEEKERLLVKRTENLITNTGITAWLTNISVSGQGNTIPIFQILSVGNGAISGVTRTDTAVAGDGFTTGARKAPTSFSIIGFTTNIATTFGVSDAIGTWTNLGIYGFKTSGSQNATTTGGTGALMTHALFAFTKPSGAYALDYLFVMSN